MVDTDGAVGSAMAVHERALRDAIVLLGGTSRGGGRVHGIASRARFEDHLIDRRGRVLASVTTHVTSGRARIVVHPQLAPFESVPRSAAALRS